MSDRSAPHDLLLRHFAAWAEDKDRQVDIDLLEELLRLRSSYDDLEPADWPAGSVEHLLLQRWPSKGAVEPPDPTALTETLDGYFRFLRNTGRMAVHSEHPKMLAKETRRAVTKMPDSAADKVNWSPTKVMFDFGRTIGIDIEGAPDPGTLQQRLDQVQAAWNALPMRERQRLMPHRDDDADETGRDKAMRDYGTDDWLVALLRMFPLPQGDLPAPEEVAPIFQQAPFVQQMLALADWVGDGRAVTGTGVLRPALAHEVHDVLGLEQWTRAQLHLQYPDESLPAVAAVGREAWIDRRATEPWHRAADCEALHRLWMGAADAGLIEVTATKARAVQDRARDAEWWVLTGVTAAIGLLGDLIDRPFSAEILVYALMASYSRNRGPVPYEEILDFQLGWRFTPEEQRRWQSSAVLSTSRRTALATALGKVEDLGLFVETNDAVTLTAAGDVFVAAWLNFRREADPE